MVKWENGADMSPDQWQRLKVVFDSVVDLPESERESRTRELCEDDELASEVLRLVHLHSVSNDFLEEPIARITEPPPPIQPRFAPEFALCGRFVVKHFLGRGGMGEVYEALDVSVQEHVALKTLPAASAADSKALDQIRSEVRKARKVTHSNVCRVHDLFDDLDAVGNPILVLSMQLLHGQTLQQSLKDQSEPLPTERAFSILADIAAGLDACHQAGVVHGDIKPGNVFLVKSGDSQRAVLTDFGLSRNADFRMGDSTFAGGGTPAFMAPELHAGGKASFASDIYALGMLASELLSASELASKEDFADGSHTRQTIDRSLDPNPSRRFKTAGDFVRTLRAARRAKMSRVAAIAACVAGVVMLAFGSVWMNGSSKRASVSVGVLPFENLSGSSFDYVADGLTEELIKDLQNDPDLNVAGRNSSFYFKGRSLPAREVASTLKVSWLVTGSVRQEGDVIHVRAQIVDSHGKSGRSHSFSRPIGSLQNLRTDLARDIHAALVPALAQSGFGGRTALKTSPEAYDALLQGRYFWNRRSVNDMRQAIAHFSRAIELDPNFAQAYAGLADVYCALGDNSQEPPAETLLKGKQSAIRALTIDPQLGHAHASFALATSLYDLDWDTAERSFRRALELDPNDVLAHQWYSALLLKLNRFAECTREAGEAVRLDELSLPANFNNALMHYFTRQYAEAIRLLKSIEERQPNYWISHELLAEAYARLGQSALAVEEAEKAAKYSAHPGHARTYGAVTYAILGSRDKALSRLQEVIQNPQLYAFQPFHVARVYAEMRQVEDALVWLDRAHEHRDPGIQITQIHHSFDGIRTDPRFERALKRMRIPTGPKIAQRQ